MSETIIAWTDFTYNPWMGCTKISAGCKNCYAAVLTKNRMGLDLWGNSKKRQITKSVFSNLKKQNILSEKSMPGVLGKGMPRLVFVGSLMDWAEDRPELIETRKKLFQDIKKMPGLHFQLLTKRADNILKFLPDDWGNGYENVWLGVSVENNDVKERIKILSKIPSTVRFVSYEPAIGILDNVDLSKIDWLIYGGESGAQRRNENKEWARSIRKDCVKYDVAFFHKQSSAFKTEQGIELDGEIVRNFPGKIKMLELALF